MPFNNSDKGVCLSFFNRKSEVKIARFSDKEGFLKFNQKNRSLSKY